MNITISNGKEKKTFNVASNTGFESPNSKGYYVKQFEIVNIENQVKEKIKEPNDFGLVLFLRDVANGWDKMVNITANMGTNETFKANWKISKLFEVCNVTDATMSFDKKEKLLKLSKQTIDSMIGKNLFGISYPYKKDEATGKLKYVTHYIFETATGNEQKDTNAKAKLEKAFNQAFEKGYVKMYTNGTEASTPMVVPKIETSKPNLNLGGANTDDDEIPF